MLLVYVCLSVCQENIFEWQFAIRGPADSEFQGGIYHGRIQLPVEYPLKPPHVSGHISSAVPSPGYHCYHGINHISKGAAQKGVFCLMDWNKKRKTGTPVWQKISSQSSPNKEYSMEDTVAEPANIFITEQGKNKSDEAETLLVRPSSTYLNDALKDSEDTSTTSQEPVNVTTSKERHAVSLEVGTSVLRFIKGKDGSTQKGIEEIGVKLKFPQYKKGDSVVIEANSMDDIAKASQKIQSVIDEAVKSPAFGYSHFISLPLAIHPEFVDKVTKFQSNILGYDDPKEFQTQTKDENSRAGGSGDQPEKDLAVGVELKIEDDIDAVRADIHIIPSLSLGPEATKPATLDDLRIDHSIFLRPQRLHLTVLMLKLWNKERIQAATDVLQGIRSKINDVLDNRPLFVRLKGLDILRGSKAKAQVLYVPIEEIGDEGRLTRACQIMTDAYVTAGLVFEKDAQQKLKLHATLMNTTFRRGRSKGKRNDSFD